MCNSSLAFTIAAHHYSLYSTDYTPSPVYSHRPVPTHPLHHFLKRTTTNFSLSGIFVTSQNEPSRVLLPIRAYPRREARFLPSALTSTLVTYRHLEARPQLSFRERECVREPLEVLITRGWTAGSARPTCKCGRRMQAARSVLHRPRVAPKTRCVFCLFSYTPTQWRILADGLRAGVVYTRLTTDSKLSPMIRPSCKRSSTARPPRHPPLTRPSPQACLASAANADYSGRSASLLEGPSS